MVPLVTLTGFPLHDVPQGLAGTRRFQHGVHHETNRSGPAYVHPNELQGVLVWMTPLGLLRSDPAFVERVVAYVPPWGQSPPYGWWMLTFSLLLDATQRRYPIWFSSVSALAEDWGMLQDFLGESFALTHAAETAPYRPSHPLDYGPIDRGTADALDGLQELLAVRGVLDAELAARLELLDRRFRPLPLAAATGS